MKKIIAFTAVATALTASVATAGGPVIVEAEPPVVVAAAPASSAGGLLLPLIGLGVVAALVASSDGSGDGTTETEADE